MWPRWELNDVFLPRTRAQPGNGIGLVISGRREVWNIVSATIVEQEMVSNGEERINAPPGLNSMRKKKTISKIKMRTRSEPKVNVLKDAKDLGQGVETEILDVQIRPKRTTARKKSAHFAANGRLATDLSEDSREWLTEQQINCRYVEAVADMAIICSQMLWVRPSPRESVPTVGTVTDAQNILYPSASWTGPDSVKDQLVKASSPHSGVAAQFADILTSSLISASLKTM
jgi:hypothetical protein